MRLKNFVFGLLALGCVAATANAATVYLNMIIDPATTAGAGIAPVTDHNGGSAASWIVSSSRSGAGSWQLFALDTSDANDTVANPNNGIGSYNITLSSVGPTPVLNQRSPNIQWNDVDGNGPYAAGFSLLRVSNQNPFAGSQPLAGSVPAFITGIGQTASNFGAKVFASQGANLDTSAWGTQASGQWGNYATISPVNGLHWVLLAEGLYSGQAPAVTAGGASVNVLNSNNGGVKIATVVLGSPQPAGNPPVVQHQEQTVFNANGTGPGTVDVSIQNMATGDTPITWDNLQFVSYTPNYGGAGPYTPANFGMTAGGLFTWDTQSAHRGDYVFSKRATNAAGNNTGTDTIHITGVPEPATLSLLGLALVGLVGAGRRRS